MGWPDKTLKQQDTFRCMAYVAAMIAGCDVEEVFRFCGHDGSGTDNDERNRHPEKRRGFMDNEINAFLASRGISRNAMGASCDGQPKFEEEDGNKGILCRIPIYLAAELTVESDKIPGGTHAVYWDGKVIRDPNPDRPDEGRIEDYKVKAWYPVVNLNEGINNKLTECPSCAAALLRAKRAEEVLYQAEELLQELADVVKSGKGCVDCGVVVRPYEINELHYKVIAFLCRRGRVYP